MKKSNELKEWSGRDWMGPERTGRERTGQERKGFKKHFENVIKPQTNKGEELMLDQYPINFKKLQKGTTISQAELLSIYKYTPTAFDLMKFRQRIIDETGFTAKVEKGEIKILTDAEASRYNVCMVNAGIRKIMVAHQRNLRVDVKELTGEQVSDHDRRITYSGALISAMIQSTKNSSETFLQPEQRKTPGLI
jgi:hypothetical protein